MEYKFEVFVIKSKGGLPGNEVAMNEALNARAAEGWLVKTMVPFLSTAIGVTFERPSA
jgi:hypothetical protein